MFPVFVKFTFFLFIEFPRCLFFSLFLFPVHKDQDAMVEVAKPKVTLWYYSLLMENSLYYFLIPLKSGTLFI